MACSDYHRTRNIAKGAIYAKIALNEKQHFHLVNTNLQHSPVAINDKLDDPTADIRRQQISQLRDFMYANIDAKEEVRDALSDCYGPVLLVGSFNVNGRASRNNGKSHSNEYDKLIQQINNSPKHFFSETGGRAQPKWRFRDVFYEKYQEHPVTLGDDEDLKDSTDPNQKPSWRSDPTLVACLPETMLTDKALIGSCQCLDYMFWSNARYPQPTERRQLHVNFKESSIEQLHVNIEKQVTQLSGIDLSPSILLRYAYKIFVIFRSLWSPNRYFLTISLILTHTHAHTRVCYLTLLHFTKVKNSNVPFVSFVSPTIPRIQP